MEGLNERRRETACDGAHGRSGYSRLVEQEESLFPRGGLREGSQAESEGEKELSLNPGAAI